MYMCIPFYVEKALVLYDYAMLTWVQNLSRSNPPLIVGNLISAISSLSATVPSIIGLQRFQDGRFKWTAISNHHIYLLYMAFDASTLGLNGITVQLDRIRRLRLTFILEIETDTSIQNVTLSLLAATFTFSR